MYSKKVIVDGAAIGLTDDCDVTPLLAQFLSLNKQLIQDRIEKIEGALDSYRLYHIQECRRKARTLSYRFLTAVYDQPQDPKELAERCLEFEEDLRVQRLMMDNKAVFKAAYERFSIVTRSEASTWWYLFWVRLSTAFAERLLRPGPGRLLEKKPPDNQGRSPACWKLQPTVSRLYSVHTPSSPRPRGLSHSTRTHVQNPTLE
jgi:hypothetical protein